MGALQSRPTPTKQSHKAIDDIYSMFEQSNRVLLDSHRQKPTKSRIKDVNSLLQQLLEPFAENCKYAWGDQIRTKFTQHFANQFEEIWAINREQFYELLLTNCNAKGEDVVRQKLKGRTYQKYFYEVAVLEIEQSIVDSFVGPVRVGERKVDYLNASILQNNALNEVEQEMLPLVIPHDKPKHELPREILLTESISSEQTQEDQLSKMRLQSCSLLLPQTVFVDRLTATSRSEITDLLKYYKQFTITLQQIFYSNNLLSCPLKNFIFCIEEKLTRKRIRPSGEQQKDLLTGGEEGRRFRRVREMNNNLLLYEIKVFMEAYTEFVWMYLQLQYMADSRLGKIVNSDILYGVIFKSVWGFVDWIAERGYEYEENKLEEYFLNDSTSEESKVSTELKQHFTNLLATIRGEKHPQQYLKKVVVFYRQVSKNCQNADELLIIYEETIGRLIRQKGGKDLGIFRMKNIIEKLLKIDENSLSGGEISYSWATWNILIELLREKVNYKYGGLLISKGTKEFPLNQSDVRSQTIEHLMAQPE